MNTRPHTHLLRLDLATLSSGIIGRRNDNTVVRGGKPVLSKTWLAEIRVKDNLAESDFVEV